MRTWTMLVFALVAAGGLTASAQAETPWLPDLRIGPGAMLRDVITPPEWGGIWSFEDQTFDCETNQLISTEAYLDTICAGSSIEFGDSEFPLTCTGSADANTVSMTCTGTFPVFENCDMEFTISFEATRNGDSFTSVQTISTTYVGEGCLFLPDECTRTESAATRVGPEPSPCEQTPVETVDWGTVKALYR